jgi:hypothetical protein
VARSILTCVAYGACRVFGRVCIVSIGKFPAVSEFFVPKSTPTGFEDVEFGFVLDVGR